MFCILNIDLCIKYNKTVISVIYTLCIKTKLKQDVRAIHLVVEINFTVPEHVTCPKSRQNVFPLFYSALLRAKYLKDCH